MLPSSAMLALLDLEHLVLVVQLPHLRYQKHLHLETVVLAVLLPLPVS